MTPKVNEVKLNRDHTVKGKEFGTGRVQQDAVDCVHPLIALNFSETVSSGMLLGFSAATSEALHFCPAVLTGG